jgi:hypothetical protein
VSVYYIDDDFVRAEGSARIIARISPSISVAELNEFTAFCITDETEAVSKTKNDILRELKRNETTLGGLFTFADIEEILDKLKVT